MADNVDYGSEKPSYAKPRTQPPPATRPRPRHEPESGHEQDENTDDASLSEDEEKPPLDRAPTKIRTSGCHMRSKTSPEKEPLESREPLELALAGIADSGAGAAGGRSTSFPTPRARTSAAATVPPSTRPCPPEYEVAFDAPADALNPRDWPQRCRLWVVAVVSFNTWVVVLYSTSYTAAMPGLLEAFGPRGDKVVTTLGVTTYLLGLATGSLVVAPMSELFGRRPVYLVCLAISMLLVLPCALATSLTEIIVARFFGALFGAVMVCNSAGTVADISTEDDRAKYMSLWSIAPLNGPVTGPLIGGFVYQYLGWRWDMWLAMILMAVSNLLMWTVKETYIPVLLKQKAARLRKEENDERYWCKYDSAGRSMAQLLRISLGRPFVLSFTEPILWFFNVWISVTYGILYLCFIAYPIIFSDMRGWSPGETGLSFIGIGAGTLLVLVLEPVWRRLINRHAADPATGRVPPEAAALVMTLGAVLTPLGQLGFAWTALPARIPYAVPIACGVPFGMGNTLCFIYGTNYLAGAYGFYAASALAGNAVMRSLFGGLLPLLGPGMFAALGPRWAGTLLGLLEVALVPIPFAFYKYGDRIRARSAVIRALRDEQAKLDKKHARLEGKTERQRRRAAATLSGGQQVLGENHTRPEDARMDGEEAAAGGAGVEGRDVEKGPETG